MKQIKNTGKIFSILIVLTVLSFSGCYSDGYESGKKRGREKAMQEAWNEYGARADNLKAELDKIKRDNENRIAAMTREHNAKVNEINSQHSTRINQLVSDHTSLTQNMQQEQQQDLARTRTESFNTGQSNMMGRIDEVFNFDVQNRETNQNWNTVLNVNRD